MERECGKRVPFFFGLIIFAKTIMMDTQPAILVLQDGTVFQGTAIGKIGTTSGEIAFNTGMTGYQEVFTDPSYYGQILTMTTAHIGNYGAYKEEVESDHTQIAGLVVKKFAKHPSRPISDQSLQAMLENDNIVGIADVDTRKLVRHIRDKGAMNAIISSENIDADQLKSKMKDVPSMEGLMLSDRVSTKEIFTVPADENEVLHVALMDYGVKKNIIRCLTERGCKVTVFPYNAKAEEVKSINPNGIMLSNGPGDPASMNEQIEEVKALRKMGLPIFGICLGHQLLCLSEGLNTEKMHNGHRGLNHPVLNLKTGKGEITSQNHGFVVKNDDVEKSANVELTHKHLNDQSVAGVAWKNEPTFCVQYHPESSAGPHDSRYLFDQFIDNMKNHK